MASATILEILTHASVRRVTREVTAIQRSTNACPTRVSMALPVRINWALTCVNASMVSRARTARLTSTSVALRPVRMEVRCRSHIISTDSHTELSDWCVCVTGTCHDLVANFICSCPPGTAGPLCELNEDDCSEDACHNGGTCVDEVNGFRCDCVPGYIGPRCEGLFVLRSHLSMRFTGNCINLICCSPPSVSSIPVR